LHEQFSPLERSEFCVRERTCRAARAELAMANEPESTGIKVNAVSPGFTKTNPNN
jgi:hypothetical protein